METVFVNLEGAQRGVSGERLREDLRVLVRDAEALIRATASDLSEGAREARSRLGATLERARVTGQHLEELSAATARVADQVIRAHPYESVGFAFGLGLLLGVLIGRR